MKLSGKSKIINSLTCKAQVNTNDSICNENIVQLHHLPNQMLENKFDIIKFCFLFFYISEDIVRKSINLSRITKRFWVQFIEKREFQKTFRLFDIKIIFNIYKYIHYFKTNSVFSKELNLKAFFYLIDEGIINERTSLASIDKKILLFLKRITRKNANKDLLSHLLDRSILDFYNLNNENKENKDNSTQNTTTQELINVDIENENINQNKPDTEIIYEFDKAVIVKGNNNSNDINIHTLKEGKEIHIYLFEKFKSNSNNSSNYGCLTDFIHRKYKHNECSNEMNKRMMNIKESKSIFIN